MEELSGIRYPETRLVSSFPACESRAHSSLGKLQQHITWTCHQQATPATLGTETSAWAQTLATYLLSKAITEGPRSEAASHEKDSLPLVLA